MTAHFQPLRRLMTGEPGKAPIDVILARMAAVQLQIRNVGTGVLGVSVASALLNPELQASLQELQQASNDVPEMPPVFGVLLGQLRSTTTKVVTTGATREIEDRYREEVLRACQEVVPGRYPFSPASARDVPLSDFRRLFGIRRRLRSVLPPEPRATRGHVEPAVVVASRRRARIPRDARNVRDRRSEIRELFFKPDAGRASVDFDLILGGTDPDVSRFVLEIDGMYYEYYARRSPTRRVEATWPGSATGTAQSGVTFEDRGGPKPGQFFQSQWGWFRLLDHYQTSRDRHTSRPVDQGRGPPGAPSRCTPPACATRSSTASGSDSPADPEQGEGFDVEVGFYGKLPSHGDFLRRRASEGFVRAWDAWLQEGLSASRAALGDQWLDVYLTSPAWRFACAAGVAGPTTVAGVIAPSVDRVGRYFPVTVVAELPPDVDVLSLAVDAAVFFDAAEQVVIETLETEEVDLEVFDLRVSRLGEELELARWANPVTLDQAAAAC